MLVELRPMQHSNLTNLIDNQGMRQQKHAVYANIRFEPTTRYLD